MAKSVSSSPSDFYLEPSSTPSSEAPLPRTVHLYQPFTRFPRVSSGYPFLRRADLLAYETSREPTENELNEAKHLSSFMEGTIQTIEQLDQKIQSETAAKKIEDLFAQASPDQFAQEQKKRQKIKEKIQVHAPFIYELAALYHQNKQSIPLVLQQLNQEQTAQLFHVFRDFCELYRQQNVFAAIAAIHYSLNPASPFLWRAQDIYRLAQATSNQTFYQSLQSSPPKTQDCLEMLFSMLYELKKRDFLSSFPGGPQIACSEAVKWQFQPLKSFTYIFLIGIMRYHIHLCLEQIKEDRGRDLSSPNAMGTNEQWLSLYETRQEIQKNLASLFPFLRGLFQFVSRQKRAYFQSINQQSEEAKKQLAKAFNLAAQWMMLTTFLYQEETIKKSEPQSEQSSSTTQYLIFKQEVSLIITYLYQSRLKHPLSHFSLLLDWLSHPFFQSENLGIDALPREKLNESRNPEQALVEQINRTENYLIDILIKSFETSSSW